MTSFLSINMAMSIVRGIPFFWRTGRDVQGFSRAGTAPYIRRWNGKSKIYHYEGPEFTGQLPGRIPQLDQQLISQFREIALSFTHGVCFRLEGNTIWEMRVIPASDHLIEGGKQSLGKEPVVAPISGKIDENSRQSVGDDLPSGVEGVAGHSGPFVIAVLPLSEAYARFPEIAPSSAKDGQ